MSVSSLPSRVAGLRVTRALARGARADLVLVRDDSGAVLVAKVFHPDGDRVGVDRELAALARVAHRHVLPLHDAECLPDGAVAAVVAHLPGGSLARWLETRERVSAGEAVTVLAPLADAVGALHAAGVAHGRLTSSRVLFDADGAPVVTGLGGAVLFSPDAAPVVRERIPEVAADLEALRGLADAVLGRIAGTGARRATELRAEVAGVPAPRVPQVLVDGLFAFAAGSPIRLVDEEDPTAQRSAGTAPRRVPAPARGSGPRPLGTPRTTPTGSGFREAMAAALEHGPLAVVGAVARRRWSGIDTGRRRMIVGLLAAGATAAIAVALVPGGSGSSSRAESGPAPAVTPSPSRAAASRPPDASDLSTRPVPPGDAAAAVRAADPLVALPVLVRTRERCLRDQDRGCLSATDEPGSPAEAADLSAVETGSGVTLSAEGARVVQTLGAVAVIETGQPPQRIALVRLADGGWRIRDLPLTAVG